MSGQKKNIFSFYSKSGTNQSKLSIHTVWSCGRVGILYK